jgi:hypothetical protein
MGKPGPREWFEHGPLTIDEFVKETKAALDEFSENMKNLGTTNNLTNFQWFYTFGYWTEALEFLDEYRGKENGYIL